MTNAIFPEISPDIYGPLIAGADVRQAVQATIELWSDPYISVMAARTGQALLPFASYEATYDRRTLPADGSASCWVVTPGTAQVERQGGGLYIATWVVETQIVVYGPDWATTADFASWYGTAVRALLLQHGSLGLASGLATGPFAEATECATSWLRERYSLVEAERQSTIGILQSQFRIKVNGVVDTSAGPKTLPAPAAGTQGPPGVDEVNITIVKTGVDGEPPYV